MKKKPGARRGSLKLLALLVFALGAVPAAGHAAACKPADATAAEAFVQSLHEGAREILRTARNPVHDMTVFIAQNVEIEKVAQSALGPSWNSATDMQRAEYVQLFRTTTLRTLAGHIAHYDGAAYRIVQARSTGEGEFLVTSTITPKADARFVLAWRVNARGCRLTASDVVNGGVSLVVTKRQEFASVIARVGVEGLVQRLRNLASRQSKGEAGNGGQGKEVLVDIVLRAAKKLGNSRY